ncbi:hypothetical protein E3Q23_01003, partial [Wallemia mellicola]
QSKIAAACLTIRPGSCLLHSCFSTKNKLTTLFKKPLKQKMRSFTASALLALAAFTSAQDVNSSMEGVVATGTMGKTNPAEPTMQAGKGDSEARLVTVNSIDDWCIFGPKDEGKTIGETEAEQVAWCTQPRNNARLIPEGTIKAAHFIKTPFYVQVVGWGDFTKIGLKDGDYGGELDPHGATGDGNPVGGNVTSNISGSDVHYAEWMEFLSYEQVCLRVCTAGNETYPASVMCEHKLDEMGCSFIMPGDYEEQNFQTCDADPAYPPGMFPVGENSYSSFAQRYTGTLTQEGGQLTTYTIGDTATPSSAAMTPSSSNCVTQSSLNVPKQSTKSTTDSNGKPTQDVTTNGGGASNQDGDSAAQSYNGLIGLVSASSIALLAGAAIFV